MLQQEVVKSSALLLDLFSLTSIGERPRSDLRLAIKDVSHGVHYAQAVGTQLEVGELTLQHLMKAKELAEERPLDSSAVYGIIRQDAGLDFDTDFVKRRDDKP